MAEDLEGIGCSMAKGNVAIKTYLCTRPVSFITKSEVEVYQLADVARVMRYGERKKFKKEVKGCGS